MNWMKLIGRKLLLFGLSLIARVFRNKKLIKNDAILLIEYYNDDLLIKDKFIDFINNNDKPFNKFNTNGHITCSAWVVNKEKNKALLINHRSLNLWLQPGGHIENSDNSLLAAALREAHEETGLSKILPITTYIFDLDIHTIPSKVNFPQHYHYDIRFILEVSEFEKIKFSFLESRDARWVDFVELLKDTTTSDSIKRLINKTIKKYF